MSKLTSKLPGFYFIYNRLPYDLDFQFDMQSYTLGAHEEVQVPLGIARMAIIKSLYFIDENGDHHHGVIHELMPNYEQLKAEPLTEKDLPDSLTIWRLDEDPNIELRPVRQDASTRVVRKKPIDPRMIFNAIGGNCQ